MPWMSAKRILKTSPSQFQIGKDDVNAVAGTMTFTKPFTQSAPASASSYRCAPIQACV